MRFLKCFLPLSLIFLVGCEGAFDILAEWEYSPLQEGVYNSEPDVAFGGGKYLVIWGEGDVLGRLIGEDGSFLSGVFNITEDETLQVHPSVATMGDSFAILWVDHRKRKGGVYGTKLPLGGDVISNGGSPIDIDETGMSGLCLSASSLSCLLTYQLGRRYWTDFLVTFLNQSLNVSNTVHVGDAIYSNRPADFDGEQYGIVGSNHIHLYSQLGEYINSVPIDFGGDPEELPKNAAVSARGGLWAIAFSYSKRSGEPDHPYLVLVDSAGVKDPPGLIDLDPSSNRGCSSVLPILLEDRVLVFWIDSERRLNVRVVLLDGEFVNPVPLKFFDGASKPLKAAIGSSTVLLVWNTYAEKEDREIWGTLFDREGNISKPSFRIAP
jgi:hypothetical protein